MCLFGGLGGGGLAEGGVGEGYAFRRSEKTALIKLNKGFFAFYGFVDYTRIDFVQRPGAAKMTGNIVDNIPPPRDNFGRFALTCFIANLQTYLRETSESLSYPFGKIVFFWLQFAEALHLQRLLPPLFDILYLWPPENEWSAFNAYIKVLRAGFDPFGNSVPTSRHAHKPQFFFSDCPFGRSAP